MKKNINLAVHQRFFKKLKGDQLKVEVTIAIVTIPEPRKTKLTETRNLVVQADSADPMTAKSWVIIKEEASQQGGAYSGEASTEMGIME